LLGISDGPFLKESPGTRGDAHPKGKRGQKREQYEKGKVDWGRPSGGIKTTSQGGRGAVRYTSPPILKGGGERFRGNGSRGGEVWGLGKLEDRDY